MDIPNHRYDVMALPALLRHARTTYGVAMRDALDTAGYGDIPRNGLYVIGGLAMSARPLALTQLVRELRISRQAASQLVDMLVTRGYLQRTIDPGDRRKLTVTLTERGNDAARVQTAAREQVDARLLEQVGTEAIQSARCTLLALIDQLREQDS